VTFLDTVNSSYSIKMYMNRYDVFGLQAVNFLVSTYVKQ